VTASEEKTIQEVLKEEIVGIDLGLKTLITTSDNETYENPQTLAKYEKQLKREQKNLARKEKGSNNYNKCRQKIAIIYRKIRNTRKYYLHKISKEITDTKSIIVTETLKIKNMLKNHKLAKAITDASWYELIRQLEYKSKQKNKRFYQIEANYPSSQLCSRCDYKQEKVKNLKVREWSCPKCGMEHERDFNASVNIMFEGLKRYMSEIN
jgi:putative transposase